MWEIPGRSASETIWLAEGVPANPAQKPEALLERVVRASSRPGDLVLDPFAGTGTTLAVAKRLGRRSVGYEVDQGMRPVIEARLDAVEADTGWCTASLSGTGWAGAGKLPPTGCGAAD